MNQLVGRDEGVMLGGVFVSEALGNVSNVPNGRLEPSALSSFHFPAC
jgi:hypothetical protein